MTGLFTTCQCNKLAFTIPEFCAALKVSRSTFYELQKAGNAPATFKAGRRVLISVIDARRWVEMQPRDNEPDIGLAGFAGFVL